jgi:3-deoxy-manno-octulosonate cytidylyltransferase (CMP-KDO synthetase)
MSDIALVIPARLGSTRLAEKALADINGQPMVVRVAQRASLVKGTKEILVATDSEKIKQAVEKAGFRAVMTDPELKSGTDRVAVVAAQLKVDIVVNLQGDEPLVQPQAIEAAMEAVLAGRTKMGSVMAPFTSLEEYLAPSNVKCITDKFKNAIYFSRHPIPYAVKQYTESQLQVDCAAGHLGRHLGIYAFTREFLLEFSKLEPTFLEIQESLEQLRALYHGIKIGMGRVERATQSVDTAEDLEFVRKIYREGKING